MSTTPAQDPSPEAWEEAKRLMRSVPFDVDVARALDAFAAKRVEEATRRVRDTYKIEPVSE